MNEKKFHFYGTTNQQQNIKIVPFEYMLKGSPSNEKYANKEKKDDVIYDDVPFTSSLSINPTNFIKTSNKDKDFSSSFNERKIEKFMSSMLVNARELCSIDQYKDSEKESKDTSNLRYNNLNCKPIKMGTKYSKGCNEKNNGGKVENDNVLQTKKVTISRRLNLASPLSNSDSHIIYQSTYNITNTKKNLTTNSSSSGESPTLSSSSSVISSSDYHNHHQTNEPPKEVILRGNINRSIGDGNEGVSSNKPLPNNCNIIKIDGYSSQNLYNNNIILEKKNKNKKEKKEKDNHYVKEGEYSQSSSIILQSSSLSSDHYQSTTNRSKNNSIGDNLIMKDKEKNKNFSGGLVKSSTVISVNPLRSLVVNDDGYYSHSPDLSKKYSNNRKNSSMTLKNSFTYHHSFFSPIKSNKSGYGSQLIDNQTSWLPNFTRKSTSIVSESSDDGKLYRTSVDNDIHLNRSLLYQTVLNIDFLVDTSSACLFGLLDKHSTSRLLNTKKVAPFSYNIRRFFSSNKHASKNGDITFYRTLKVPSCFGMSLSDVQGYCEGEVLPKCIFEIMKFLLDHAPTTDGIFRKSGVRSRIEKLKSQCIVKFPNEKVFYKDNGECLLTLSQVHDVADTLKQYFREIPGKLFSEKISDFFITIANGLPSDKQIEALRYVLILIEDTNRYAALALFSFLNKISSWASENNMSAENLAVCFTPSLFNLNTESDKTTNSMSNLRLKRRKTIAMPSEQELMEYQGAQKSLALMIKHYDQLFSLPTDLWRQLMIRSPLYAYNCYHQPTININNITERDIKECQNQIRGLVYEIVNDYGLDWNNWIQDCCYSDITIYHKPVEKCKFQLIRASFMVGVSPHEMWKVLNINRKAWERNVDYASSVVTISNDSDIQLISYKNYDERQENSKKCLLFRTWRKDSPELRGGVVLAERSIYDKEFTHSNRHNIFPDVTFSCFLIMPSENGLSKVNYIHKADVKGRSEVYYSKVYPKIITQRMINLKNFFNTNLPSKSHSNGPLKGKESSF